MKQQFEIFVVLYLTHNSHSSIFAFCFILPRREGKVYLASQVVCCFVEPLEKEERRNHHSTERTLSDIWSFLRFYFSLQSLMVNLYVIIRQILFYLIGDPFYSFPLFLRVLFLHALVIVFPSFSQKVQCFSYSSKRTNTTHIMHTHTQFRVSTQQAQVLRH